MSVWDTFLKAKQSLSARIENALGSGKEINPMAIRREILDQVVSKAVVDANGKTFPFARIAVRLQPQTVKQREALNDAFVREDALKKYLLQALTDSQVQYPQELEIRVELQEIFGIVDSSSQSLFEIDFVRPNVLRLEEVPEIRLSVIRGAAEQPVYQMKRDRILVGRPAEVLDREGRIVRKNTIVFLENDDEVVASVGNAHARIWYDYEKCGFWIMDEGSRYGTRILRSGSVIEVPSDDPSGVQLQPGDDLYFGQAGLHFEPV